MVVIWCNCFGIIFVIDCLGLVVGDNLLLVFYCCIFLFMWDINFVLFICFG